MNSDPHHVHTEGGHTRDPDMAAVAIRSDISDSGRPSTPIAICCYTCAVARVQIFFIGMCADMCMNTNVDMYIDMCVDESGAMKPPDKQSLAM